LAIRRAGLRNYWPPENCRDRRSTREIMLLMEGAMVLMLIHGDRKYAVAAARAAEQLLKQ
jgi:hypothetical protein